MKCKSEYNRRILVASGENFSFLWRFESIPSFNNHHMTMASSDHDSGSSEALATTPFIIFAYWFLPSLYDSVGPVKTSDGLWTMCIALIWTGLGVRISGPDHRAR